MTGGAGRALLLEHSPGSWAQPPQWPHASHQSHSSLALLHPAAGTTFFCHICLSHPAQNLLWLPTALGERPGFLPTLRASSCHPHTEAFLTLLGSCCLTLGNFLGKWEEV